MQTISQKRSARAPSHWDSRNERRINCRGNHMPSAMRVRCTQYDSEKRDVHQIAQVALKEQVFADILEFPVKGVARITGASLDTIKAWRVGRRFPSWEYLKRLEPYLESVRLYVAKEFPNSVNGDGVGDIAAGLLHLVQTEPPQQAAIYRAALAAYLQRMGQ